MQIETRSLEATDTAPHWCDPIAAFIAWLAHLFDQIAKMKRVRHNTRFKPNWRDHFAGLRQIEWLRDQVLAAGAAHLLAGGSLDDDIGFIPSTEPPADYGGPCPRTPQLMNRRFLAVARFNADPEAAIIKHARRIAKRAGIDLNNPLAAHGSTDAAFHAAAHHEAGGHCDVQTLSTLMVSSALCARPSNHEGRQRAPPGAIGHARGPPLASAPLSSIATHRTRTPSLRDRRRMPATNQRNSFTPHIALTIRRPPPETIIRPAKPAARTTSRRTPVNNPAP